MRSILKIPRAENDAEDHFFYNTAPSTEEFTRRRLRNHGDAELPPRPIRVTFTTVEFHACALILGDNPAVSVGPPLGAWGVALSEMGEAVPAVILTLDAYETKRPRRRKWRQLIVPKTTREDWLREQGVACGEMAKVEDEIKVIKMHRRRNARKGLWERIQVVFRSIDRSARDEVFSSIDRNARDEVSRSIDRSARDEVFRSILTLDAYETKRSRRRKWRQLIVPKTTREDWLREQGVACGEMAKVEDDIKVIKMHRRRNARKGL